MNTPPSTPTTAFSEPDELLTKLHKSHYDTIDGTDGCDKAITEAKQQILAAVEKMIDEAAPALVKGIEYGQHNLAVANYKSNLKNLLYGDKR